MITKAPSHGDGKPIGTPMDAKTPWQAGVTMGPDHLERAAQARREEKRQRRLRAKQRVLAQPQTDKDAYWYETKRRRVRAQQWKNQLTSRKRRWTIADLAAGTGFTPDDILAEIQWLDARQDRNRRAKHSKQQTRAIRRAFNERSASATPGGAVAGKRRMTLRLSIRANVSSYSSRG